MHLDLDEPCQIAFQKGFTILTPCRQQPGFIEWLLGARPMPGPGDAGEKQPGSCCFCDSQSLSPRAASGAASELKGRRSFHRNQKRRGEDILGGGGGLARPGWLGELAGSGDVLYWSGEPTHGAPISGGHTGVVLRSKTVVPPSWGFGRISQEGREHMGCYSTRLFL